MKTLTRAILMVALMSGGFAVGFSLGITQGFNRGCEWALVQADILAREEGLDMPVSFTEDTFQIVQRQPAGLHRRVWQMADRQYDEDMRNTRNDMTEGETVDEVMPALYKPSLPEQFPQKGDQQMQNLKVSFR
jgi:hypothetical protein